MGALLLAVLLAAPAAAQDPARLKCLLARPLVVGASVSAGYTATDPGTLLARKYGTADDVVRRAKPGEKSAEVLASVTDLELSTATLVIALDLFFWDSRKGPCAEAARSVGAFFQRLANAARPAAVGNIPSTGGACGGPVSEAIAAACAALASGCALVDLRAPTLAAAENGGLDVRDEWISAEELSPDRLHPSRVGAMVVAVDLEKALSASPIGCR